MADQYSNAIIVISMILAGITGARIAFFLSKKWSLGGTATNWFFCAGGAVSAGLLLYISVPAIIYGGNLFGLVALVASVPVVGLAWGSVLGTIMIFERVLTGLMKKLEATA